MRWSREEAIRYLSDNTTNPSGDIRKAIERYIVYPGQATAYMIGKLKIMELRQRAMDTLGDDFDWRGFHDAVLAPGPVPLDLRSGRPYAPRRCAACRFAGRVRSGPCGWTLTG